MSVKAILEQRKIRELMHFTTNKGLIGMLAMGELLSRQRLPAEKYLIHICTFNCDARKDKDWLDYVNLSIGWINPKLFDIASNRWHGGKDFWWCILSFDASVATHDGVYFATTNNMYTGVKRAPGSAGLEALYAPAIVPYVDGAGRPLVSSTVRRPAELAAQFPTDAQAEVLYPKSLSLDYLLRIYTPDEELADLTSSVLFLFDREIDVVVRPELFFRYSRRS